MYRYDLGGQEVLNELIPRDQLIELKPASEVKSVADSALLVQEKQAVAFAINSAANSGQHEIVISKSLSDAIIEELEGLGYIVVSNPGAADPSKIYKIMGF